MLDKHSGKVFAGKRTGKLFLLAILILGIQAAAKSCGVAAVSEGQDSIGTAMLKSVSDEAQVMVYSQFMPSIAFLDQGSLRTYWLLQEEIDCLFPFYGYLNRYVMQEPEAGAEDIRTILLAEAEEESNLSELEDEPQESPVRDGEGVTPQEGQEDLSDLLRAENEAAQPQLSPSTFQPHERQTELELASLDDYETLVRQFYTIDANTTAGSDQLNVRKFLAEDMTISREEGDGPQILIYHTHSQEAFADSVPGDESATIMGVGEHLTEILTQEYGYRVLHHLGKYDTDSRDDSYAEALTDLERILEEYPSIEVVIDLHRDEMPEGTRLVMDLDGRPTARFMFFNGLSRTKKTGNIAYLYNENLDGNLAFSFQMQKAAMEYYPNLTRRIYLKGYRYNMHLRPKTLLIELGAQNNTLEEVMNACEPLAHILDIVLSGGT